MGVFHGKEYFTVKPWLNDYLQNVERLKEILGITGETALPEITAEDEGKVLAVDSGVASWQTPSSGGADIFTVNMSIVDSQWTLDKNYNEISGAISSGKVLVFQFDDSDTTYYYTMNRMTGNSTLGFYAVGLLIYDSNLYEIVFNSSSPTGTLTYIPELN